jgi:hypothetical protein
MLTPAAEEALGILHDGSQFQWYVIPLLAFVTYVYAHVIRGASSCAASPSSVLSLSSV